MIKACMALLLLVPSLQANDAERFPIGKRPDVSQLGFKDLKGNTCQVANFKGKVVVVDFWAVWCPPCRMSLPELQQLQKEGAAKGNLVVIPCNLDEDLWPGTVTAFFRKHSKIFDGFTYYRSMVGKQGIATNLGSDISSFPTTLVIDQEGKLAVRWSGYAEGVLVKEINQLLNERPAQ